MNIFLGNMVCCNHIRSKCHLNRISSLLNNRIVQNIASDLDCTLILPSKSLKLKEFKALCRNRKIACYLHLLSPDDWVSCAQLQISWIDSALLSENEVLFEQVGTTETSVWLCLCHDRYNKVLFTMERWWIRAYLILSAISFISRRWYKTHSITTVR